ncbi:T9SS type A sorting domain-containing protein [Lewinella sp. IMCC34183]|uniref:T9SS type A sorting domain-containing protein n=1 Tax=Lewinella sp. IMCC34183 TaxID=2248762 RepID=UPI000E221DE1|nr:T9SS type A sorting domain-containing protein [Lewinella sp. IMCC34183]
MRKTLLSLLLAFVAVTATAQTVVYVDADASGAEDGSSWADAYTDLQIAINNSAAGSSLWIAAGRYVTPDTASFYIDRELGLYGGFAGDETAAEAANPDENETILSGDVDGDDGPTFDADLSEDNNRVLLVVDTNTTSQFTVTLSGLTIRDGIIAEDYVNQVNPLAFAGGGLLSTARLDVRDVTFMRNRAYFGSAISLLFATSVESRFDGLSVSENYSYGIGAFFLQDTEEIEIANSTFTGNPAAPAISGAALASVSGRKITLTSCTFENLRAGAGGAMYFANSNALPTTVPRTATDCVIDDCTFNNVSSTEFGGAILFSNQSHTISNSTFTEIENTTGVGGAIFAQNPDAADHEYVIRGSEFSGITAGDRGGAIFYNAVYVDVTIEDSEFTGNYSPASGGAVAIVGDSLDRSSTARIVNSRFIQNASDAVGGAVVAFNKGLTITGSTFSNNSGEMGTVALGGAGKVYTVERTDFTGNGQRENSSSYRGGAIAALLNSGPVVDQLRIDSSTFTSNTVTQEEGIISGGGALFINGGAGNRPRVDITRSNFNSNSTLEGADGGAIQVINGVDLRITSSDFVLNSSTGWGGAINTFQFPEFDTINNVPVGSYLAGNQGDLTIRRGYFLNNQATDQGGAINTTSGSIDMRNSILIGNFVNLDGGSGGAVLINGSSFPDAVLDNYLINNTFLNNTDGGREAEGANPASAGNAVGVYQPGGTDATSNSVTLTIQNNAFFQALPDEEAIGLERATDGLPSEEVGAVEVISLGGNFFSSSLEDDADLTVTNQSGADVVDTEVDVEEVFTDPFGDLSDFPEVELADNATNPLIDAGATGDLVPGVDFFNAERDAMPDIGAIEFGADRPSALITPLAQSGLSLEFYPNPAVEVVNIINSDPAIRSFGVLVSDMQGRLLSSRQFSGATNRLEVGALPKGMYNLTLLVNGKLYSQQIMKQ